jgi:hypothetical protein
VGFGSTPPSVEATTAANGGIRFHAVQPGESLTAICREHYGDDALVAALAQFNDLEDPDTVRVGHMQPRRGRIVGWHGQTCLPMHDLLDRRSGLRRREGRRIGARLLVVAPIEVEQGRLGGPALGERIIARLEIGERLSAGRGEVVGDQDPDHEDQREPNHECKLVFSRHFA